MSEAACVLVVDDDPDVREMLTEYLSGQGYRVLAADGAARARERVAECRPDIVQLDVGLPGGRPQPRPPPPRAPRPAEARVMRTVRGLGYMFVPSPRG